MAQAVRAKTYVLLDHLSPTAPIYVRAGKDHRVKLTKIPVAHPYLQVTFTEKPKSEEEEGINRTIRLKLNSNTPYQDIQIEKEKIPANEKFTPGERNAVKFTYGALTTTNPVVQKFLDVHPQNEIFEGLRPEEIPIPMFKEYSKSVEIKNDNLEFKERLKAANKISGFELRDAQDMLIRLYGSFYPVPSDLFECQNLLVKYMDEVEDGYKDIIKERSAVDDETNILIGRAITAQIISFDAVPNQVAKKKGNTWINLKEVSSEHDPVERQRYFAEFLTSESGKLLRDDLKKEVEKTIKK